MLLINLRKEYILHSYFLWMTNMNSVLNQENNLCDKFERSHYPFAG